MTITQSSTLAEAKEWLRDRAEDGETCPCCTQFVKVYKRTIHATMARDLIRFYREAGVGEWLHLPSLTGWGGDFGKLRYWNLVQEETEIRREDGGRAGFWRVTEVGAEFVHNLVYVPRYAHVYDGRCIRMSGEGISIRTCLGTKFDYNELMGALMERQHGMRKRLQEFQHENNAISERRKARLSDQIDEIRRQNPDASVESSREHRRMGTAGIPRDVVFLRKMAIPGKRRKK